VTEDKKFDQQYKAMLRPAKERLLHRDARDIADKTGTEFDEKSSCFRFTSMGKPISVSYPEYDMNPIFDNWHHLVTLHYLDMADGTPSKSELMSFSSLAGSGSRGLLFNRQAEDTIGSFFGNKPAENVEKICEDLGASFMPSNADLCAVFHYLPRYPVTLKLWFGDDEFKGSGRLLLDESALHYLSVEDAVTVGSYILETLVLKYNDRSPY